MVKDFKEGFRQRLEALGKQLTPTDKMKVALNTIGADGKNISLSTVIRYTSGNIEEIRILEVAESIESTAKEVLREKEKAASTV